MSAISSDSCTTTSKQNGSLSQNGAPLPTINAADVKVKEAYQANFSVHRTGISHNEMVQGYNKWANKYDEDLNPSVYTGPVIAATFVGELYPEKDQREKIKVIDIAAGTGRVGYELAKRGFKCIDALEPAEKMLTMAQERNVYTNCILDSIGDHRTEIDDDTYDCVAIAGGMGEGHIPTNALNEMIRIVKPAGLICITMREEYLSYVGEYVDHLEPYMKQLQKDGLWTIVSRTIVPNYSFNKNGVVFVYKVV